MDIRKLQRAIVDGLEDVKAADIVVFNTEHLSPLFERVIIASGTSNRQTKALAASVRDAVKSRGMPVLRTEGQANGEWIIVDCGAAVAHIMQPAIREYYHLEEIWGDKPVKMKLDGRAASLPKAEVVGVVHLAAPAKPASRGRSKGDGPRQAMPSKSSKTKPVRAPKAEAGSARAAALKRAAGKSAAAKTSKPRKPITSITGTASRSGAQTHVSTLKRGTAPGAASPAPARARKPASTPRSSAAGARGGAKPTGKRSGSAPRKTTARR